MITIRPTIPDDQAQLQDLLAAVWNDDTSAMAYYGNGKRAGFVLEDEQKIVGYGCVWSSHLHPTYTYLGIHIVQEKQNQGLEKILFEALKQEAIAPFKIKLYDYQTATIEVLQQLGFVKSVTTHLPILHLDSVLSEKIEIWRNQAIAKGFEIMSMPQALNQYSMQDMLVLHDQVYAYSHRHDPSTLGYLDKDDFLGEDLVPDWLYIASKNGELAAVSSVRKDTPLPMLGWFGSNAKYAEDGEILTLLLTALSLEAAAKAGVKTVTVELDDVDNNAVAILNNFAWQEQPKWLTFTTKV